MNVGPPLEGMTSQYSGNTTVLSPLFSSNQNFSNSLFSSEFLNNLIKTQQQDYFTTAQNSGSSLPSFPSHVGSFESFGSNGAHLTFPTDAAPKNTSLHDWIRTEICAKCPFGLAPPPPLAAEDFSSSSKDPRPTSD